MRCQRLRGVLNSPFRVLEKKKVCKGQRSVVKVQRVYKRRTASYFPSNEDDEMTKTKTASTAG